MKVLIDWDGQYPALYLRFPGEALHALYDGNLTEVPDEIAVRWRDTRDAWWAMVAEVEAFGKARLAPGDVTQ